MIDMEAIKKRDENQDDVYAVADRSALLAECERLQEATEPEVCRWWREDESLPEWRHVGDGLRADLGAYRRRRAEGTRYGLLPQMRQTPCCRERGGK